MPITVPLRLDLHATLSAGQTFCWEPTADGAWQGEIRSTFCRLRQSGDNLEVDGPVSEELIRDYFHFTPRWEEWLQALPEDPVLRRARQVCCGLRLVRDDWWPCTAAFICSSLKPVPLIRRLQWAMRRRFAPAGASFPALPFPSPQQIAGAPEFLLRQIGLGYRARHLHAAARMIADGIFSFEKVETLSTPDAAHELQKLPGVGPKIAHCILLYAGGRLDAFPLDVWMTRVLRQHYGRPGRRLRSLSDCERFAARYFGPCRGLAQLYLFHAARQGLLNAAETTDKGTGKPAHRLLRHTSRSEKSNAPAVCARRSAPPGKDKSPAESSAGSPSPG